MMMKKMYTISEVAEITSLGYRTVLKLIQSDFIHSVTIGRKHLISEKQLEAFVDSAEKTSIIYDLK